MPVTNITSSWTSGKLFFHRKLAPKVEVPALKDPSEYFEYFNDFIGHVNFPAATGIAGGWKGVGDATYTVLAAAGSLGGQVQITPATGSNNEVYMQVGQLGSETFIEYTKNSGKKSWVEFRVAYTSVTNAGNTLVGLASEGAAAADFIADAGNDISDVDFVGFAVWEGAPATCNAIHQITGSGFVEPGACQTAVAGTFYTLGLYFDGKETVTWYVDGVAKQTADLDTATFPTGEELSPMFGLKAGAADPTLEIDWIWMAVER